VRELCLILGDQLFEGLPGMPTGVPIFMRESYDLAIRTRHHQQKIVLFFSAMRHFEKAVQTTAHYEPYNPLDKRSFVQSLIDYCTKSGITRVFAYEPADQFMRSALEASGLNVEWVENPMFLTSHRDWVVYAKRSKRRLMGEFYQFQRRRLGILLEENGTPLGGRWSFDEDNRKALPKNVLPPPLNIPTNDSVTSEVIQLVSTHFANHPGQAHQFMYPVTHTEAKTWLAEFLDERLERFGDYEDAIPQRERTLFHSLLTPMLNTGLLTPSYVVQETLKRNAPVNSKEGFIRQVIGWREFIYWMSREKDYTNVNHFGFTRKLAPCWWNATTGLPPVDLVIQRTINHAWAHHIERLMVVGAVMLMCEVDPHDSYNWFMEMFIDSADWVMAPNVLGMSQFADGGYFATKPYLCGSSYILKMSDWGKGPWCDVWDGLYWSFIDRHRELFAKNPRMSMMAKSVDKLDPTRKERIYTAADNFIQRVTV
jgi:deoxyribodipyrimidine photolyase-related protein